MIDEIIAPFENFSSVEWPAIVAIAQLLFLAVRPLLSADSTGLPSLGTGIAKFKFAKSLHTAERIVKGWNSARRKLAKRDLLVDVPIVVASAAGFAAIVSSTITSVIDNSWPWVGVVTRYAAWAPLIAGCSGLAEDWFLWRTIRRIETTPPKPLSLTQWFAKKFAAIRIGLLGISAAWFTLVTVPLLIAP